MRRLPIWQVDAFAEALFGGNPAAVVPLDAWLPVTTMQAIAAENNVSETAFLVPATDSAAADFELRWFTPEVEVPLCGHATLASAHVLFEERGFAQPRLRFMTASGVLSVERREGLLWLDLPSLPPQPLAEVPPELVLGLGAAPKTLQVHGEKFLAVYAEASTVADLRPDMGLLGKLTGKGVVATAPGGTAFPGVDFVSRYFTPGCGIPEDPVTGSAHCLLAPYWGEQLGRTRMLALQISARRGRVEVEFRGTRVGLGGRAQLYLVGEIRVP